MAGKRITSSLINWQAFSEVVSSKNLPKYFALKARNDSYVRRVGDHPADLPKIDWNHYKSAIYTPGIVDSFQKAYEALKIPYPSDQGLISQIDEQEKQMKTDLAAFVELNIREIEKLKVRLTKLESTKKYSEMTKEELFEAVPEILKQFNYEDEKKEVKKEIK